MGPPPPYLLGSGIPATQGRPQRLRGHALQPPASAGLCQRLPGTEWGRYQACLLASRALLAQMLPNAVTAPGEPRGQAGWGFGIPQSSCPGRRVSSFQAEWQDSAPLPSSRSQRKTLAGPLILSPARDGWLPAAWSRPGKIPRTLHGCTAQALKPEWPLPNPSSPLPPPPPWLPQPPFPSFPSKPPVRATTERVISTWEGLRTEGILCPWSPSLCQAPC